MAGRPKTKKEATPPPTKRESVVAAATKLFLEEGYGATGMDAIAREANVSKATVYSYYEDKASLFADVMVRMCEDVGGPPPDELLKGGPPEVILRAIALYGLQRVLESSRRQILQRVVSEVREFPELGQKFWENGPGRIEAVVARYLTEAKRQGALSVDDPARAASRLVGQIMGLYVVPMLTGVRGRPTDAEIRRDVDEVVAGFLATVRSKKS